LALILNGQSITLDDPPRELRLSGFLLDMNAFFQALLGRFMSEHLDACGVVQEERLHGLFAYDPKHNPRGRRDPQPRPDFVVRRGAAANVLLDAKYRDLWGRPLPREMLYQLAIYALAQGGTNASATILYPSFAPRTRDQVVVFNDVMRGAPKARVILRPVNLPRVERLLRAGGSWRTHGSSRRAASRQRGSWWVMSPRMSLAALARAPGRRACHYGCDTSTRNQRGSWVPKSCGCRSVCPR
jgi:5-methylcytosine-specific restriction enzyme subunit McrC